MHFSIVNYPVCCWVKSDIKMDYPPLIMMDDKETVQPFKEKSRYNKKIHCSNTFPMIV